jgi:hypothetical protein
MIPTTKAAATSSPVRTGRGGRVNRAIGAVWAALVLHGSRHPLPVTAPCLSGLALPCCCLTCCLMLLPCWRYVALDDDATRRETRRRRPVLDPPGMVGEPSRKAAKALFWLLYPTQAFKREAAACSPAPHSGGVPFSDPAGGSTAAARMTGVNLQAGTRSAGRGPASAYDTRSQRIGPGWRGWRGYTNPI